MRLVRWCHVNQTKLLTFFVTSQSQVVLLLVDNQGSALDIKLVAADEGNLRVTNVYLGNTFGVGSHITCCGI